MDMWKKCEILNNKKFRILLLLEVLLLLVPVIGILRGNKTISTLSDAQDDIDHEVLQLLRYKFIVYLLSLSELSLNGDAGL